MKLRTIVALILVFVLGLFSGSILMRQAEAGPQPHMEAALRHLEQGLHQLEAAKPNKGGHRAKAIHLVKGAIVETKLGIEFANRHK